MNNLFSENYYKRKYLKYKSKYLYEKNNLSGGLKCGNLLRSTTIEKAKELKKEDCLVTDFKGFAPTILRDAFTPEEFKKKFKLSDLLSIGLTIKGLKEAGFAIKDLIMDDPNINATKLIEMGKKKNELKEDKVTKDELIQFLMDQGFTTKELKEKKFNAEELVTANIPIEKIKEAFGDVLSNLPPGVFKRKGYTIKQLKDLGYTPCQLRELFTREEFEKEKFVYYEKSQCKIDDKGLINNGKSTDWEVHRLGNY